ncbi:MAG TPA: CAP domain-containing protein [Solirubrobacterales bacterium]|nr:CAP domain-containing protein [Solirubrobacterales bacterium]
MGHKLSLATTAFLAVLCTASFAAFGAAQASATTPLLAPATVCPRPALDAPTEAQEQSMLCLVNYARQQVGDGTLEASPQLEESARDKANDIVQCDSFSHYACGREFTYWMKETGYLSGCWRAGENLAYGEGAYGTTTSIFRAWLRSPTHRANLLGPQYVQTGIDLKVGRLEGTPGVHIWAQHFGVHC